LTRERTEAVFSKILDLSLEMGSTKTFKELGERQDEELKLLNLRIELEQKLRGLHLPIQKEIEILEGLNLETAEGLETLEKEIKKAAQKVWEEEQSEHLAKVEEFKNEKKRRMEILAMQEEARKEKEARQEQLKQLEKKKEKQNLIALRNIEMSEKKKIDQERNEMYKEEYQRAKALMYVRNIKKQSLPLNPDGNGFAIDWKDAYNEYVQYKKSQKKKRVRENQ
jgi:hypothetical protein